MRRVIEQVSEVLPCISGGRACYSVTVTVARSGGGRRAHESMYRTNAMMAARAIPSSGGIITLETGPPEIGVTIYPAEGMGFGRRACVFVDAYKSIPHVSPHRTFC